MVLVLSKVWKIVRLTNDKVLYLGTKLFSGMFVLIYTITGNVSVPPQCTLLAILSLKEKSDIANLLVEKLFYFSFI